MDGLATIPRQDLTAAGNLDQSAFASWVSYLDAKPKTVEAYRKSIRQFAYYLNDRGISKPEREDVLAYRDYLKQNHKPTTVQSYMAAVKLFFRWAEQEGLYPNIADHIKGAKVDDSHKKDYLTSKQSKRLLTCIDTSSLKGLRDYAMLSLMITTGLRTISVVQANIEDIRTVGDNVVLFYQGKGHEEKGTYVKLSEQVEKALYDYLSARGEDNAAAPLFGSIANRNNGERMTTRSVSRVAKDHLIDAGLNSDRLTAHSLRHTAATLNLLNGGSVEETRQLLDHASINTTLIYSHALERAKNNSELRISKAIFGD